MYGPKRAGHIGSCWLCSSSLYQTRAIADRDVVPGAPGRPCRSSETCEFSYVSFACRATGSTGDAFVRRSGTTKRAPTRTAASDSGVNLRSDIVLELPRLRCGVAALRLVPPLLLARALHWLAAFPEGAPGWIARTTTC